MQSESQLAELLIVEDNKRLAELAKEYLEKNGYKVGIENRGDTAVNRIINEQPDLLILDLMLPGLDGMDICKQVRENLKFNNPILMLTARDEDIDQVLGLELGADDYIIKPVKTRVLLARVQNLLKRHNSNPLNASNKQQTNHKEELHFPNLQINPSTQTIIHNEKKLTLATQDFELLLFLAKNAGNILSRDEIITQLRGGEYDGLDRSIDIRVTRLRKHLHDNPAQPKYIKTIRGKGYLFIDS